MWIRWDLLSGFHISGNLWDFKKCPIFQYRSYLIYNNILPKSMGGGWGVSKVVATFKHVGGSFNLFMATTGDVWIIPSFRTWDNVPHVEHVSCVITNWCPHQWVIPSPLSIALYALLEENTARKLLSLSIDLFLKILLFLVAFLIFSVTIFFPYFLLVGLLLQYVALFQSR